MRRVAIVGIGNPLGGDDAVGPRAAAALAGREALPAGVRALDAGTLGIDVLALIEPGEAVVLLDVVRVEAPPGTIHSIPLEAVRDPDVPALSVHELGVRHLLQAARALGRPLRGVLLGVEPARVGPFLDGLSDEVAAAQEALEEAAIQAARRLLESG